MTIENDPVKIIHFALLEFRCTPDWGERRQVNLVRSVARAQAQDERTVFQFHREEMIDDLDEPGLRRFDDFFNRPFQSLDDLFADHFLLEHRIEPVDPR